MLKSIIIAIALAVVGTAEAMADLNENCVVSVLNRSTQVRPDGSWILPNIPAGFGPVRARATCTENGITRSGQSPLFEIPVGGDVDVPAIVFDEPAPIPVSLNASTNRTRLEFPGDAAVITVAANYPDGSAADVTTFLQGTQYTTSNDQIVEVNQVGVVEAVGSGSAFVTAINEGVLAVIRFDVLLGSDSDSDGIPDSDEIALGLDPNNAADALEDPDSDGLTNLDEFRLGTDLFTPNVDTDGDGIADEEEIVPGADGFITSPLLADTDGDGVRDKLEIDTGSDPTSAASVNLADALSSIAVAPDVFGIVVNTIFPLESLQLRVTGTLDDNTQIDLTSTNRGTNYTSSDLFVCNFGVNDGEVFGGEDGDCIITVANSGFQDTANGVVNRFAPSPVSQLSVPGFLNNVDVNGSFAYLAAGAAGLQIVDLSNRNAAQVVGFADTPGNANDVKVSGDTAYVADGNSGLQILDVSNPSAPSIIGSVDTPGEAFDLVISGTTAYVADGTSGLQIINVANPATADIVRTMDTPGIAKGVDVDSIRSIAVVADSGTEVQVLDLSPQAANPLLSTINLSGSDARDVVLRHPFVHIAGFNASYQRVDITDPTSPVFGTLLPVADGGIPNDLALSGRFAFVAGIGSAVIPILDVNDPANPANRGSIGFGDLADFDAHGIAADGSFIYLATVRDTPDVEHGDTGESRLFIGQYLALEDLAGIAPEVSITAPADGATFIEGVQIPVSATASDDIGVTVVELLLDGTPFFSDTSAPYSGSVTAPVGVGQASISARAVDHGANAAESLEVIVNVIPDPLTTAQGVVVDNASNPVDGAEVTCLNFIGISGADGSFSVPGLPTIDGPFRCTATKVDPSQGLLSGLSGLEEPEPGGITQFGNLRVSPEGVFVTLVFGDPGSNGERAQLAADLGALGFDVTVADSLPADIAGFDVIWSTSSTTPLNFDEQLALVDALDAGTGIHFSGGSTACCSTHNAELESFFQLTVLLNPKSEVPQQITVGNFGGNPEPPYFFNPDALAGLTSAPNTLHGFTESPAGVFNPDTVWAGTSAGGFGGLNGPFFEPPGGGAPADPNVFLNSTNDLGVAVGVAFGCDALTTAGGRITAILDATWFTETAEADRRRIIGNIQQFLGAASACDI